MLYGQPTGSAGRFRHNGFWRLAVHVLLGPVATIVDFAEDDLDRTGRGDSFVAARNQIEFMGREGPRSVLRNGVSEALHAFISIAGGQRNSIDPEPKSQPDDSLQ